MFPVTQRPTGVSDRPSGNSRSHCLRIVAATLLGILFMVCRSNIAKAANDGPFIPAELSRRGVIVRNGWHVEIPETASLGDADVVDVEDLGRIVTLACHSRSLTSQGLVNILSKLNGLKNVTLSGPSVTDDVIAALGRHLSLERIDLQGPIHGHNMELLVPLKLRMLSLRCEPVKRKSPFFGETFGLTDEAMEQVGELRGLENLSLIGCGISDEHLAELQTLGELMWLRLDGNPIDGSGLGALAPLKRLQELGLSSCRLSDGALVVFPHLDSLAHLNLANNQIGDSVVTSLAKANLDELLTLNMSRTDLTDRSLASIALLKRIKTLVLSGTRIENVEALSASPIKALDLSWTPLSGRAVQQLSDIPQLQALNLYGTPITDDALSTLAALKSLGLLTVGNTNLSEASIDSLRKNLPDCRVNVRRERPFYVHPRVFPRTRIAD